MLMSSDATYNLPKLQKKSTPRLVSPGACKFVKYNRSQIVELRSRQWCL
jgi:hypothetical protein